MANKVRKEEYQKLFVFSSKHMKDLIEAMLKDKSKAENKTVSAIIEGTLLDSFMPANKEMHDYIMDLYNPDRNGVHLVLSHIMSNNSISVGNSLVRHTNFLPLVQFMYEESVYFNKRPNEHAAYHHFLPQFADVCAILLKADIGEHQHAYVSFLLNEAKNEPEFAHFGRILRIVLDYWNLLLNIPATYKMLMDIADIEEEYWQKDSREKLYQILCTMAEEW